MPKIIKGNTHIDSRGILKYNNDFNSSEVKRIYLIENDNIHLKRGWQGHKIEQRWFSVVSGTFGILAIKIDDWDSPDGNLAPLIFQLSSEKMDILHVPSGYITCIHAKEDNSKLLVMADYILGEIEDEYRFPLVQFQCTQNYY